MWHVRDLITSREPSKLVFHLLTDIPVLLMAGLRCVQGDSRDMALMALSIGVFVYISMHLYNVYAMLYYAAGFKPISHFLP